MRLILCLLAALVVAGCSTSQKELAKPDGQVFRLNADKWEDTVNDAVAARTVAVRR